MSKVIAAASSQSSKNNKDVAAAYLRVSTREQEEKYSIPYQKENASKYADSKNLKLQYIFEEANTASKITHKDENDEFDLELSLGFRPKLQEIIKLVEEKRIQHLIVDCRDRLSRNMEQFIALNLFFERNGVQIHYSRPGELSKEKNNISTFLEIILASVAELEANIISTRVKSGVLKRVRDGNWPGGRIPLGYVLKERSPNRESSKARKTTLKASGDEKKIVVEIFKEYSQGLSYSEIADSLAKKYESMKWSKRKVQNILTNETYTGQIVWDRKD